METTVGAAEDQRNFFPICDEGNQFHPLIPSPHDTFSVVKIATRKCPHHRLGFNLSDRRV